MKIKLLVSFAGVGFALDAGAETDRFSEAEAIRMIEAGYAEPVAVASVETATRKVREKR